MSMAGPKHPVAQNRAADKRTVLRPTFWRGKQALDQSFRDSQSMHRQWQVNMDQRIRRFQPIPHGFSAITVDDPLIAGYQRGMRLQIFLLRDRNTAWPELEHIDHVQRQSRDRRQFMSQRRFATAGVAEDRDSLHARLNVLLSHGRSGPLGSTTGLASSSLGPSMGNTHSKPLQRCVHPGQQHGLRMPPRSLSMPTSMRRFLVSSFLADVTQQIHSFRASGVISTQRLLTAAVDSRALRKSAGSLWTVPPVIF